MRTVILELGQSSALGRAKACGTGERERTLQFSKRFISARGSFPACRADCALLTPDSTLSVLHHFTNLRGLLRQCFVPFQMTDSIAVELHGDWTNIFTPLGRVMVVGWCISVMCLLVFQLWAAMESRALHAAESSSAPCVEEGLHTRDGEKGKDLVDRKATDGGLAGHVGDAGKCSVGSAGVPNAERGFGDNSANSTSCAGADQVPGIDKGKDSIMPAVAFASTGTCSTRWQTLRRSCRHPGAAAWCSHLSAGQQHTLIVLMAR